MTGRCLCGAVAFELTPPTDFLSICHCRSCRLSSGAPFYTCGDSVQKYRGKGVERLK